MIENESNGNISRKNFHLNHELYAGSLYIALYSSAQNIQVPEQFKTSLLKSLCSSTTQYCYSWNIDNLFFIEVWIFVSPVHIIMLINWASSDQTTES